LLNLHRGDEPFAVVVETEAAQLLVAHIGLRLIERFDRVLPVETNFFPRGDIGSDGCLIYAATDERALQMRQREAVRSDAKSFFDRQRAFPFCALAVRLAKVSSGRRSGAGSGNGIG